MIQTTCPECKGSIEVPQSQEGKTETCPECGKEIIVPKQHTIQGFQIPTKCAPRQPGDGTKLTACIMMALGVIVMILTGGNRTSEAITGPICGTVVLVGGVLLFALGNILAAISKQK